MAETAPSQLEERDQLMHCRISLSGPAFETLAARHVEHANNSALRPFVLLWRFISGGVPF